ncbi:MAG TPA: RibD family protein [candidate division Zixibacteria bacterium]|nr:RibD family protein [candidate division Zixibacteria bacterium]
MNAADPGQLLVDRLWPDPATGLPLDEVFAEIDRPAAADGRPWVATNMVTSIDGRAQVEGTAEGLSSRPDRRLMRLYRAAFDAVGSGVGTLRADDFYSTLPKELAERRRARRLPPQPTAVLICGASPIPTDRRWFGYEQPRIVVVGASSPHAREGGQLPGVETWVAPTDRPDPPWILARLAERGIRSLLLEGGPTTNAAFLAAGVLDELFWTIGPRVVAGDALPMIASVREPAGRELPVEAMLVSVHRSGDELFLRYRFG